MAPPCPLGLVQEDGEWRIDEVPDALIVPESWFDDWYERASLYYFDPTTEVLVAEPVFVPRGDQFASSLVRGLVTQPSPELQDVVRTLLPAGHRARSLGADHLAASPRSRSRAIRTRSTSRPPSGCSPSSSGRSGRNRRSGRPAQRRRSDDRRAQRLTPGQPEFGSGYDPNGVRATTDLFALDQGMVVTGPMGELAATLGPLGQEESGYDLRSIGVSLSGVRVAGVPPRARTWWWRRPSRPPVR